MVSIYDCTEPNVIDENLLTKAVEEERPDGEAGRIILQDGVRFADIKSIALSFKHILKIENLWSFSSLQRLNLDNNLIEKIEGLDSLVNLKWLDLSFNNIEVIEGLENLKKLEDLTLYSNHITILENLDNLVNLQIFSIGNNQLHNLENVMVLHKLKKLQTLNLHGNPLCDIPDYKLYVVAFLPQVQFLDYRLIDDETRKSSLIKYANTIEDLNAKDKNSQAQQQLQEKLLTEQELLNAAYVAPLKNGALFHMLFSDDKAATLLLSLEGVGKIYNYFESHFVQLSEDLFNLGLNDYHVRERESTLFVNILTEAKDINQTAAANLIEEYLEYKAELNAMFSKEEEKPEDDNQLGVLNEWNEKISSLWEKLMEIELHLSNQIEEVMKEFDRNLLEAINLTCEQIQAICAQMRDLENQYSEQLSEITSFYLEKILKEEEMPTESMKDLFSDKEMLSNTLVASHDARTAIIDSLEDTMLNGIKNWMKTILENLHEEEVQRNRQRILEINHFIDSQKSDLQELEDIFTDETTQEE